MNAAFEGKRQASLQGHSIAAVSKKQRVDKKAVKAQLKHEEKADEASSNLQDCIEQINQFEDDAETKPSSIGKGQHRREPALSKRKSDNENNFNKKPKRPMSSYNYFFKEERTLITAALSHAYTNEQAQQVLASFGEYNIQLDQSSDLPGIPLEKKKKFNGVVSFQDICKIIGRRWRSLDKESLKKYSDMAKLDTIRYRDAMEKYLKERDDRELKDASSQDASDDDTDRSECLMRNETDASDERSTAFAELSRAINISRFEQAVAAPFLFETFNPSTLTAAQLLDTNERPSLINPMFSIPTNNDLGLVTTIFPSQTYSSPIPRIGLSNLSSNAFIDSGMNTLEEISFLRQTPRFHSLEQQVAEGNARLALDYQEVTGNVLLPLQHSSGPDVGHIDLDSLLASHLLQDSGPQIWQGSQVAAQRRPLMEGSPLTLQQVWQALLNTDMSNLLHSSRMQVEDPYSRPISLFSATQVPFTLQHLRRAVDDAYTNVRYPLVGAGASFSNNMLSENNASILLQVLLGSQLP